MTVAQQESDPNSSQDPVGFSQLRRCTSLAGSMELDSGDTLFPIVDEERPKTRRVNPQRLALRLGPDLVAEMEALIVPGAKMPTFAVRKDFQDRYCVDRRHIYDYFHSRGLRVAKEDKHTNLKRRRIIKDEQTQRLASLVPKLPTEDLLQDYPGHTSTPTVAAESLSDPTPKLPPLQFSKRAATYPGNLHVKRTKKAAPVRNISPPPSLLPSPTTPDMLSASFPKPATFIEVSDLYSRSDGLDTMMTYCYERTSDGSSLSAIDDSQEYKLEDFMPPHDSSWALDQCNNLYDLLDGEYPYVHDPPHLAESYQIQGVRGLFTQSLGNGFSGSDLQSLDDNAFEGFVKTAETLGNSVETSL